MQAAGGVTAVGSRLPVYAIAVVGFTSTFVMLRFLDQIS